MCVRIRALGWFVAFTIAGSLLTPTANAQRGGTPPSQPVLTAPLLSKTGNFTVSWTSGGGTLRAFLEESKNGGTYTPITVSTGAISKTFSGKAAAVYKYRVKICSTVSGCSPLSAAKTTHVVTQVSPTANSYPNETYVVLKGDANADGRLDFLVTKPSGSSGVVANYYLIQKADKSFSVVQSMGSTMNYIAHRWPVSNLAVYRDDLSFDHHMDFLISNVQSEIPSSRDMIVYTERNVGLTAIKALLLDNEFQTAYEEIILSLWEPHAFRDAFNGFTCPTTSFEIGPIITTCTFIDLRDIFDSTIDIGLDLCVVTLSLGSGREECFQKSDAFHPGMVDFYNVFRNFIHGGAAHCSNCIDNYIDQHLTSAYAPMSGAVGTASTAARAARVARVAFILAGIMVADDVSVVGVWNDALIPVVLLIGGFAQVIAESENSTITQTDPFARTGNCRPQDPQHISGIGNTVNIGSTRKLKNNLLNAGCSCPQGLSNGHHIVQKAGGIFGTDAWGANSRAILDDCGIDIDDAVNGVCLPSSREIQQETGTGAVIHQGDGIHSKDYNRVLNESLNNAFDNDGCEGVTNELKNLGDGLSEGVKFW